MRTALLLAALLAACGPSPAARGSTAARARGDSPAVSPMQWHVGTSAPSYTILRPSRLDPLPDRYQALGPWRVELLDGGRSEVAERPFLSPIRTARRCGEGWVFLTTDGTLAYAPSFAGEASAIGRAPISDAQSTLRATDDTVLWSDGTFAMHGPCAGPLRRAEPVRGAVVRDVWGRGSRRLAFVEGRDLYLSDDGGESWRALDVAVPGGEFFPGGSFRVAEAWYRVDEAGAVVNSEEVPYDEREWPRPEAPPAEAEDAEARAQGALLTRRHSANVLLDEMAVPDGEGGHLLPIARGRTAPLIRVVGGAFESIDLGDDPPADFPSYEVRARVERFGPRAAVIFADDSLRVFRDGRLEPIPLPPGPSRRALISSVLLSDDGRHVAFDGPCEPSEPVDPEARCLIDVVDGSSTPFTLPDTAQMRAVRGGHVMFIGASFFGSIEPGRGQARRMPISIDGPERLERVAIVDDGTLWARVTRESGEDTPPVAPRMRLWLPGAEESVDRELPEGALSVASDGSGFWLAFGDTSDEIWSSEDGGRRWVPLPTPLARPAALTQEGRSFPLAHCVSQGCRVGPLWLERDARVAASPIIEPPALELAPPGPFLRARPSRLSCRVTGPAAPSPWGRIPNGWASVLAAGESRRVGLRTRTERRRALARVAWTVPDGEGTQDAASDWFTVPADLGSCFVIGSSPFALLLQCDVIPAEPEDEVEEEELEDEGYEPRERLLALVRRGGGFSALDGLQATHDFEDVRAVGERFLIVDPWVGVSAWVIAADGSAPGRIELAAYAPSSEERYVSAAIAGAPAVFVQRPPTPGVSTAYVRALAPLGAMRPLALPIPHEALPVCAPEEASDVRVWRPAERVEWEGGGQQSIPETTFELSLRDAQTCVRSASGGLSLRPEGDALLGHLDNEEGERLPVRCEVTPPERRREFEVDR